MHDLTDVSKLALYPFVTQAQDYVRNLNVSLLDLFNKRGYEAVRLRAKSRVIESISKGITKTKTDGETASNIELLSYPIARILVSCINDNLLTRRYALAEAKASHTFLEREDEHMLVAVGRDFNVSASFENEHFRMHFTDYIRLSAGMRDIKWKLVNRQLNNGFVGVGSLEFARLLQEATFRRILSELPLDVPEDMCKQVAPYVNGIVAELAEYKSNNHTGDFGEVNAEFFPPCIRHALSGVRGGVNLGHSTRFALTSFLLNIGMNVDEVVGMFNVSPDFDESKTRYQVEHIAGSSGVEYSTPGCDTMKTYGNCSGKDELCDRIVHPLGYYSRKAWFASRNKSKQDVKQDGNQDSQHDDNQGTKDNQDNRKQDGSQDGENGGKQDT